MQPRGRDLARGYGRTVRGRGRDLADHQSADADAISPRRADAESASARRDLSDGQSADADTILRGAAAAQSATADTILRTGNPRARTRSPARHADGGIRTHELPPRRPARQPLRRYAPRP